MTQTVTPYLLYEDGEAASAFLTRAFGFREVDRQVGAAGGLHLELDTELGGRVYAGQAPQGFRNPADAGRTSLVYVLVPAVDAHHARAKQEGATIVEELVDLPFGHRRYTCRDPQGHEWSFAQVIDARRHSRPRRPEPAAWSYERRASRQRHKRGGRQEDGRDGGRAGHRDQRTRRRSRRSSRPGRGTSAVAMSRASRVCNGATLPANRGERASDDAAMNRAVAGVAIDTLRRVPLFEGLDPAELQSIADSMHEANVPAGAVVTAEGGPADGFFVIDDGEAEATVEGQPQATMRPGDYFGEIALLMRSGRTATVTATTDLRCFALTPSDFKTLVEGNLTIAWKVLQSMAARFDG